MTVNQRAFLGFGYLVVIVALLGLSVGIYNKAMPWQDTVPVTLTTATPGLELNPHSDVKLQGVLVGEVREVTTDGRDATIHIALDPDKVELIPANVDATILPKTLFGEKYVDLRLPASPTDRRIAANDVIRQSSTSVEIGRLFDDVVPVLRTLRPEQLSVLLSSAAQALEGQGRTLGETVKLFADFARDLEPAYDTLNHDVTQFTDVSNLYADVAPDLMRLLGNSATISREVLVPEQKKFDEFLDSVIETANISADVLRRNTQSIVTLSGRSRPVLQVLDTYAHALGCLVVTLREADELADQSLGARGPYVLLSVDMMTRTAPYAYPDDLPDSTSSDANPKNLPSWIPSWKPYCSRLPSWAVSLEDAGPNSLPGWGGVATEPSQPAPSVFGDSNAAATAEARRALARALASQSMGVSQDELPPYAELLVTPLLSGGTVSVR